MAHQDSQSLSTGISWLGLIFGVILGVGAGLFYTWNVDPVIEKNIRPWQLGTQAREQYVIAVALSYSYNHDLDLAFDRLMALRPTQNVWDMVAEVACERHRTVQIRRNSDVVAMRALEQLYRSQGANGCADGQYPTPAPVSFNTPTPTLTPTATLLPPPTKTPTPPIPTNTPIDLVEPTRIPAPTGGYTLARLDAFCDAALDGVIEVRVFDVRGEGVPGIPIQVSWGGESDTFFTGLKPGREPGFADFKMTPGSSYTVTLLNQISTPRALEGVTCETTDESGNTVTTHTSYWVNFQQQAD